MKEVGWVDSSGVVNAILFALYDEIQAIPATEWAQIHEVPLSSLIPRAQSHINQQRLNQQRPTLAEQIMGGNKVERR